MKIQVNISALRQTSWRQLAIRFICGGLVTAATGIIAKEYGPRIAGLFLAFPAILPAGATLIEKHERQRKERAGFNGSVRARKAVAADAAGAAMGSIGLLAFAALITILITSHRSWAIILLATITWMAFSFLVWLLRKKILTAVSRPTNRASQMRV
ncbi:MAG: DUF3147 family protein [Candidatus Sulfotelmatobacter sp.]